MTKKITLFTGLALVLALPAVALAKPHADQADKRAAKAECKTLRGKTAATREAFRTEFKNFAACVKAKAADEAREEQTAHKNAAKECKAERDELGQQEFSKQYGTEQSKGRNAFGKCVSEKARAKEAAADEQDQEDATTFKNAAKECAAERDEMGEEAFGAEYGTEQSNRRNAFGKCVSKKVREAEAEQQA
jgi:hypothetical protein